MPSPPRRVRRVPLASLAFGLLVVALGPAAMARAATLPSGFQETTVFQWLTQPTAVEFASDGRVFIAEKSGLIKVFGSLSDPTPSIFADLRTNTHNYWDRGLLGLVLHPNFPATPYVYVLYTLDAEIGGTPPRWGSFGGSSDSCPSPPGDTADGCVVAGRVSRLTASGNMMVGTEEIFVENWCQQYPSHSIGTIAFGADGALYVSGGDGASFNFVDYGQFGFPDVNPCGDPPGGVGATLTQPTSEGGALRSQDLLTAGDPVTFDGTVLRLDPTNGTPMPDNPLVGNAVPDDDPIIAYGLRNPFRMAARPGTNELWIGDVGWTSFEEINRIGHTGDIAIENFGWPCYEGIDRQPAYEGGSLLCGSLYAAPGAVTDPFFQYHHLAKVVDGESCSVGSSSITGLAFYQGGSYPTLYDGALFFADYSRNCIWAVPLGPDGEPDVSQRMTFAAQALAPVELEIGPGGDLFYVDITYGRLMRISYVAVSQPPLAVIEADVTDGPVPLLVQLDGSGSSDPDPGDVLTYSWDLDGNGTFDDSTLVAPVSNYETPGTYDVKLRVTDPHGASATSHVTITAGNTRPTASIATPTGATSWQAGSVIGFSGSATDPEEGTLGGAALTWTVVIQHCPSNCHEHTMQTFTGASGSFTAPDHEYPTHLELRLTATDAGGLTHTTSVALYPDTVDLTFATDPPGLTLTAGATGAAAPFLKTVIVNGIVTMSAPSPQTLHDTTYDFAAWSDGGAPSHAVLAPATDTTYEALFSAIEPTATATATPEPTATATVTSEPTASTTSTPEATASATPSATPTVTATATVTPTPTETATPTATASATPTVTATETVTPTPTSSPTITATPTATGTPQPTATLTTTPQPTTTATATAEPTTTVTVTATPVVTTTPTPGPGAGACDSATVIPSEGGSFAGTTSGPGTLAGSCANSAAAPERVYQWTPTTSGTATIRTCSGTDTAYDTVVYVRRASCAGGVEVACNDDAPSCLTSEPSDHHGSRLNPTVVAGETYFIIVDGYASSQGSFSLTVVPPAPGAPTPTPAPNACQSATVIPPDGGTFTGVTSGASTLAGTCAASNTSPEQVFEWTPSESGPALIQTCDGAGTGYDTLVYLRQGDCTSGIEIACNDDAQGCFTSEPNSYRASRITPNVIAGETYYIVVDGYGGRQGAFSLSVSGPGAAPTPTPVPTMTALPTSTVPLVAPTPTPVASPTLVAGTCAQPIVLPAGGGTVSGTTTGGPSQLGGQCATSGNSPEVVYAWTPTTSGTAELSTCGATGTSYDTVVYVRDPGCGGGDLACNDDTPACGTASNPSHGSHLTLSVVAGQTYMLVVDGYNGGHGTYQLTVLPPS